MLGTLLLGGAWMLLAGQAAAPPPASPSTPPPAVPPPPVTPPAAPAKAIPVAPRRGDATLLEVPEEHRRHGIVFAANPKEGTQVKLISDSPIDRFEGVTTAVAGYIILADAATALKGESAPKLADGGFRIACESIRTGISLRDEHMLGEHWLDADHYPDITYALIGFTNATRALEGGPGSTWIGTLEGELTIHGITRRLDIPGAKVTITPANAAAKTQEKITLQCAFDITLREFAINTTMLGVSVAERLKVEQTVTLFAEPRKDIGR